MSDAQAQTDREAGNVPITVEYREITHETKKSAKVCLKQGVFFFPKSQISLDRDAKAMTLPTWLHQAKMKEGPAPEMDRSQGDQLIHAVPANRFQTMKTSPPSIP